MVIKTPIICRHCKKDTGYTAEGFMFMVLTHDVLCPHCGKVVIKINRPMWSQGGKAPYYATTCTG